MEFEIVGPLRNPETIAAGLSVRDRVRLRRCYGRARWHKREGVATVRMPDGVVCEAEVHWYEATGIW